MAQDTTNKFIIFSPKQQKVLEWWRQDSPYKDFDAIVCDGAVRSGKTVSMALGFILWGNTAFKNKNLALCGKTIGTLRKNVVEPLKEILKGRGFTVKDKQVENYLVISNKDINGRIIKNKYYLYGGKDEGSQDLIQGITLAGILFDEVALMPESFINQATARCSIEGSKYWFNCNPEGPYHPFKTNWIDDDKKLVLHIHFTMDDNFSLSDSMKAKYRSRYAGVFYQRFILGRWVMAEGVVYDMFDEIRNIKSNPFTKYDADRLFIAIDYGTQNPCTFGRYGVKQGHYHLFDDYYYSGREKMKQKTDREYIDDLIKFVGEDHIKYITIDPSASSLIAEMRTRTFFREHNIRLIPAKNAVIKGIQAVSIKLQEGKFTIEPTCMEDKREFGAYIWDENASKKGSDVPVKENDHCMDRNRYGIFTDMVINKSTSNVSGKGARFNNGI